MSLPRSFVRMMEKHVAILLHRIVAVGTVVLRAQKHVARIKRVKGSVVTRSQRHVAMGPVVIRQTVKYVIRGHAWTVMLKLGGR